MNNHRDQRADEAVPQSENVITTPSGADPSEGEADESRISAISACLLTGASRGTAMLREEETREWLRVLVVEDDPVSQRQITHFLSGGGYQASVASNGREGLAMALQKSPHVVITDWVMPEMDGPELCKALRASPRGALVYIIMLTMHEEEARLVEAFEAGANDYLVKPFNRRVLAARFGAGRRIVELHRALGRERADNLRHIRELSVLNQRLSESAMTDALTGLPNRRHAMEQLDLEWLSATRSGASLSCLLVDVDKFKDINDTRGHDVGDRALRDVAMMLRGATRRNELVCRLGGDEFLVICGQTGEEAARSLGERMRAAVETQCTWDEHERITVTIGVATYTLAMNRPPELLRAADQALLKAKRTQRNSVMVAIS